MADQSSPPAGAMGESRASTLVITGLPTQNPSTIFRAARVPTRVLVRNTGPTTVRIAYSATALTGPANSGTDHYQLPSGGEDVFILAPNQGLYAVSVGNGGLISYAASDALPVALPGAM